MRGAGLVAALSLSAASSACYVRGPFGLPLAIAGTALVTAAIISASQPPPPRVIYVPAPRPGYAWQPGYWTLQGGEWVWVEGQWIALQPGYAWVPTHWVQTADGNWRLEPGHWVTEAPPPPPPPPPPAPQ